MERNPIDPSGAKWPGIVLRSHDLKFITVFDSSGNPSKYSMPDGDLIWETTRVMQTGDSVYGVIAFVFPGYTAKLPTSAQIELSAKDMLDRTIETERILLMSVAREEPDVFPCRVIPE